MTHLSNAEIVSRIRAMIAQNIADTGLHIQGVIDRPLHDRIASSVWF